MLSQQPTVQEFPLHLFPAISFNGDAIKLKQGDTTEVTPEKGVKAALLQISTEERVEIAGQKSDMFLKRLFPVITMVDTN